MPFSSFSYALFLPLTLLAFYAAPARMRGAALLLASLIFYAFIGHPLLLIVLAGCAGITYLSGLQLAPGLPPERRRAWLWLGILGNLAPLIALKYLGFFAANACAALQWAGLAGAASHFALLPQSFVLPSIGVSFYAFQAISYLADVYLELEEPERRFGQFALYLCFFPKLLQGPIERAGNLLPQLRGEFAPGYDQLRTGLLLAAWGLFKKAAVADRLAMLVNPVYDHIAGWPGISFVLATFFYAVQIYADFSGYTDMAIGSAMLFGIQLSPNFRFPYQAASVAEFWRRWHISLSSWLLDYLFRPLQMRWRGAPRLANPMALLATFVLCGLWHGAQWTYVVWGLLHGVYMVASLLTRNWRKKWFQRTPLSRHPRLAEGYRIAVTFGLVCFAWIFFRAGSLADARHILGTLPSGWTECFRGMLDRAYVSRYVLLGQAPADFVLAGLGIAVLAAVEWAQQRIPLSQFHARPAWMRWTVYYALTAGILFLGVFGVRQFIYFQF